MGEPAGASRVAILARDLTWADESGGVLPFSYAARTLHASLLSAPDLSDVESVVIDLKSDDPEVFFEQLREFRPTLVAASTYIWSLHVFCRLAERVRRWDPSVRFILGGPAARPAVFALAPYRPYARFIDGLVIGEGEEAIREATRRHRAADWPRGVPGLLAQSPLGWRPAPLVSKPELDDYPSPYQLGVVPQDSIGFLETFRGCPISCAFCQWGDEAGTRVHSAEYLASHLRGMKDAGVETIYLLDAGFNLSSRAFRSLRAAEREAQVLKDIKVLGHLYPTYVKDEHLEFFNEIGQVEINVGLQSLDPDVLKRLGRPFDIPRFERLLGEIGGHSEVTLEIILGLPGDNAESFRRTLDRAMELTSLVRVFYCLALPDALLDRAEEFNVVFDPDTFMVASCDGWSEPVLTREWERVRELARTMGRPNFGPNWLDFRTGVSAGARERRSEPPAVPELLGGASAWLRAEALAANPRWELGEIRRHPGRVILEFSQGLVLEVAAVDPGAERRSFMQVGGLAFSYQGQLPDERVRDVRAFLERFAPVVAGRSIDEL
ncbi:MAG: B12-binding domain-containing radical SAM protein [Polyangiaceae bacterium]|nr:B12-binding domain-containing radical SAM protein [Polyangiaceae bacterium]